MNAAHDPLLLLTKPVNNKKALKQYQERINELYKDILAGVADFLTQYQAQDLCQAKLTNVNHLSVQMSL